MSFVVRKLGKSVSQQQVSGILHALGFEAFETAPSILTVTVPSWRATKDVSLKDDLVEEIGRMVGYGEITPTPPLVASEPPPQSPMRLFLRTLRSQFVAQGFTEIYNYSFTNEAEVARFGAAIEEHVGVTNPIASDLTHLRRSLLPGLYKNILSNVRQYPEFRIFEIGNEIYASTASDLPKETTHGAAALYNVRGDAQDFFELKRVVECLFPSARLTPTHARSYEHPARAAEVHWRGSVIGRQFELHPLLLEKESAGGRAFFLDVDLQLAQELAASIAVKFTPVRKYPASGFDLSVVTALRTPAALVQDELTKLAGSYLATIDFVRQYDGPPLAAGQKSVTYRLEVGAQDHTLSAEEVLEIRNRILSGMRDLGFDFRG